MIDYIDPEPRYSDATVAHGFVFLGGQVPEDASADIQAQTRSVLAQIDALLERCGSDKAHILEATIYLADIAADYDGMNEVWDAWTAPGRAPARACIGSQTRPPRLESGNQADGYPQARLKPPSLPPAEQAPRDSRHNRAPLGACLFMPEERKAQCSSVPTTLGHPRLRATWHRLMRIFPRIIEPYPIAICQALSQGAPASRTTTNHRLLKDIHHEMAAKIHHPEPVWIYV